MNANSATKPRMMPIKNLAKNGPVGVLKPRCITLLARTFQSTRTRRRREQYMALIVFCLRHFLADFIICTCEFDFRQAQLCDPQICCAAGGRHFQGRCEDRYFEKLLPKRRSCCGRSSRRWSVADPRQSHANAGARHRCHARDPGIRARP
jgi:hypothetical protein